MNTQYLERPQKPKLAYVYTSGDGPLVVFLGGYRSDMNGTKALHFEQQCRERGCGYLRLDYSGHGLSGGRFDEGSIGAWAQDAVDVINHVVHIDTPLVLVGSSMGGWMAFLVAQKLNHRIEAMIGIAAAPDFTEEIYSRLNQEQRSNLETQGYALVPNDYSDEPYRFSRDFYEEAKQHLILNKDINFDFSMTLVQGKQDKDVLPNTPQKIRSSLDKDDIKIVFVEEGDHRLSRPEDLDLITQEIFSTCAYT